MISTVVDGWGVVLLWMGWGGVVSTVVDGWGRGVSTVVDGWGG